VAKNRSKSNMTKQELQRLAGIPHLPTDLTYELRLAVSGEGPRAYDWADKPHRLLWDACAALERAEERLRQAVLAERQACVEICRDVARDRALVGDRDGASAAGECAETIRGGA
jgi:hypothetical protein